MTREEAREWFKNALWNNDFFPETEDAFKVAIEALSADTVSRSQYQGLLNAIGKVYVEVVRCEVCKHQDHCHETVAHTKKHDGFIERWSEPIEWCSKGERRE